MRHFFLILPILLLAAFALPAQAAAPQYSTARLASPVAAAGEDVTVPVMVTVGLAPGWKTYWRTPGDAGLAPAFDWSGSENFQDATVSWPAPFRFTIFDIDNFGYKDSVTFPIDITPQAPGAALALKLKLDVLVCSEICVPETHRLSLDIPAGATAPSGEASLYQAAMQKLPSFDDTQITFGKAWLDVDAENKNFLVVRAETAAAPSADADLFVEHTGGAVFGKPVFDYNADTRRLNIVAPIHSTLPLAQLQQSLSEGTLTLTLTDGAQAIEGTLALGDKPAGQELPKKPLPEKMKGIDITLLLMAVLGGLILNLMPCVLPVLSLKVLSVVSHGGSENRRTIFRNFMASALGIVTSFWLMAGALVALKTTGESIGWGIQFQHPGFLVFLIVILLLFAANMWGAFEIPLPRFIARHAVAKHEHEPTLLGHFLTGAFATLLATPCTAPFLGTAIGFALARGAFEIFLVFTFLGLGLALPYIALAISPGVFKYMPRPGAWMVTLKKLLALCLLAVAIWLGTVLLTITTTPALDRGWDKFDQSLIAPAVREGKTVIVDVTADWCLTCKANKRFVLERDTIVAALSAENIVRLQADWTHRDPAIAAYLASFGRYGIPFNVVYGPHAPEGIPLPELLTEKAVLSALAVASGE